MLSRVARVTASAVGGGGLAAFTAVQLGYEGELALGLARADDALRPALQAALPAEAFIALYSSSRTPFIHAMSAASSPADTSLRTRHKAMGLTFRNDLGNSAGLDKDGSLLDFSYALGAGFTVVGTVLSEPHTGNVFSFLGGLWSGNAWTPLPQSGAALNSLGLPSKGVDAAVVNIKAFRERHGIPPQRAEQRRAATPAASDAPCFPIGVSIMGHPKHANDATQKLAGIVYCVEKALPVSDFIEINESCPNVHHGSGGGGASDAELAARLKAVVKARDAEAKASGRRVPILVKLGDVGDAKKTVRFLSKLGVDGLVALNTQKDYAAFKLPERDQALLSHYTAKYGGGLSGPPMLERSTKRAAEAQQAAADLRLGGTFTVIHVGGVQSAEDVQASRATGCELRQWYTGLMHGLAQPEPWSLYARVTRK